MELLKKPLDKYRLKEKIYSLGSLAWYLLVYYAKIVLFMFVLITCIVFWIIIGNNLYNLGFNFLNSISFMLKIVIVAIGIIIISEIVDSIMAIKRKYQR